MLDIATSPVSWTPCYRIVASRFPAVQLFDRVADPADLDAVIAIESMTNPRLRDEIGQLQLVPLEDRISGPGSSPIMAAFTHLNPDGSRFSDGSFGVYYAGRDIETSVAETVYQRERFLRATNEPPIDLDMRVNATDLGATLADLRGDDFRDHPVYDPDDYGPGKALAVRLRAQGSDGIVYHSVRRKGGQCAALFRPRLLSNCHQERHLCYVWDGTRIATLYEKRDAAIILH